MADLHFIGHDGTLVHAKVRELDLQFALPAVVAGLADLQMAAETLTINVQLTRAQHQLFRRAFWPPTRLRWQALQKARGRKWKRAAWRRRQRWPSDT